MVIKNINSFTAMKLRDAIIKNPQESRKKRLLDLFEKNGLSNRSNFRFHIGNMKIILYFWIMKLCSGNVLLTT